MALVRKVVRFRQPYKMYNSGEKAGYPAHLADELIRQNIATEVADHPTTRREALKQRAEQAGAAARAAAAEADKAFAALDELADDEDEAGAAETATEPSHGAGDAGGFEVPHPDSWQKAVAEAKAERDVERLNAWAAADHRESVQTAIAMRLAELQQMRNAGFDG